MTNSRPIVRAVIRPSAIVLAAAVLAIGSQLLSWQVFVLATGVIVAILLGLYRPVWLFWALVVFLPFSHGVFVIVVGSDLTYWIEPTLLIVVVGLSGRALLNRARSFRVKTSAARS